MSEASRSTITVEIDPTTPLPDRHLGSDEDGPQYGPVSLYDAIVAAAVDRLVGYGEKSVQKLVVEEMREGIARVLDERLPGLIEAALNEEVETGDGWTSKKSSLRAIIAEQIRREIKPSKDPYDGRTTFDKVLREQVEYGITQQFSEEIAQARAAIKAKMTAKAAELLAAESLRAVGVR
jgi:hypothetical protein